MKHREARVQCYRQPPYALVRWLMNPGDPYVEVDTMHDHGRCKRLEHNISKNCPHMRINLEVGFLNITYMKMAWHIMMQLMQYISRNWIKGETTLPKATVNGGTTMLKTRETKWKKRVMCNLRGVMCKMDHHQNNASQNRNMNSTISFLIFF